MKREGWGEPSAWNFGREFHRSSLFSEPHDRWRRVAAAFRAARRSPDRPLVQIAFMADRCRALLPRCLALARACLASALRETELVRSRLNARRIALERTADFRRARRRCLLWRAVLAGKRIPALLAFESPMAMACFAERAPCTPWRTCSISSRTNSPACVEGDLPFFLSRRARARTDFSGMSNPLS